MTVPHLHTFDLQLCAHAVENVAQHLGRPSFAAQVDKALANRPLLRDYLKKAADPSLEAEEARLLLNDSELNALEMAVEFALTLRWEPSPALHRRYINTLKEIRENLSGQAAEDWSADCGRFARELEGERLRLQEGIDIVRQWVRRLRTLLRAMGAVELLPAPEGRSPTPTHPTPAPPTPNKPSTEPVAPMPPAGLMPSTEPISGLAVVLSQLTDIASKMSAPTATQAPPAEALSKEDAAKFLGVPVKTVEYLIRVRKIQYVQLGSQRGRVIPVEALRKLLQDNTQLTAQEEFRRRAARR